MPNPPSHGGARPGAGRRHRYGEPTVQVRIPESIVPTVVTALSDFKLRKALTDLALVPAAVRPPPLQILSVLTKVAAGFPSPADDYVDEDIDLNRLLVKNAPATFFYTVEKDADSMINKGIMGGDRLLVDRSIEPKSRDVVLAVITGEGATVKELQIRGGTIRLIPHSPNAAHKPRSFKGGDELLIVGVVTSCIRQFRP